MLIPFKYLFDKYGIKDIGILHIGGSYGQEASAYHEQGVARVVFVEAIRQVYNQLKLNVRPYGYQALHACVSDKDGEIVTFNISNNEMQSSSILEFGTHTKEHPGVVFTSKTKLQTVTADTLLKTHGIDPKDYQFINLDIQGAELMALKGMDLTHVQYAYIEVNEKELYKGCPLIAEIDEYLRMYDLIRAETHLTPHGWGDAFYIKKPRNKMNIIDVPEYFRPKHPFQYPADNDIEFERWFMMNFRGAEGRTYLPIMWTAFYCRNQYGKHIGSLQNFIDTLDKSRKYFTIVQYDDGILNDLTGLDIKIFGMSGGRKDHTLPLICKPHKVAPRPRTNFASFVGRRTHKIREQLLGMDFPSGYIVTDKVQKLTQYCETLSSSVFALCPRGYGPTSFRICEALQYGCIPVYISDEFLEPHGIPFDSYGIKVKTEELPNLNKILLSHNVTSLQQCAKHAYDTLYTYQANFDLIIKNLNDERES